MAASVREAEDAGLIEFIRPRLPVNLGEIVKAVDEATMGGRRTVERVLRDHEGRKWHGIRAMQNNKMRYFR